MSAPAAPLRLFASLGPGDIVGAERALVAGAHVGGETSIPFSSQLTEWCRQRGVALLAVGDNPRADRLTDGAITLVQRAKPLAGAGGLRFHARQALAAVRLARAARAFRADLAIIDSGAAHYFALALLARAGIPVAINFHNVLWPQGYRPQGRAAPAIAKLDGRFFRRHVPAVLGCSPACGAEASELAGRAIPFFEWRGQFRREGFAAAAPRAAATPFTLLFVGRAEENKGVLDLLALAGLLRRRRPGAVRIEVCGDGGALAALRAGVAAAGLDDAVLIHGRLDRAALLPVYARADAVIVPTRGSFCEGLPLVCAEAAIAGRPIVTSRLSNALPVLGPAIVEAQPEDVASYADAVLALPDDPARYAACAAAALALAPMFFDRAQGYPAAIDRMLAAIRPGWRPLDDYAPVYARLG